jgi:hypothetical protein
MDPVEMQCQNIDTGYYYVKPFTFMGFSILHLVLMGIGAFVVIFIVCLSVRSCFRKPKTDLAQLMLLQQMRQTGPTQPLLPAAAPAAVPTAPPYPPSPYGYPPSPYGPPPT